MVKALDRLRDYDVLLETSGEIQVNNRGLILEGRFERRSNGKNFFVPDDDAKLSIFPKNSKHAMNGDRVRVQLLAKRNGPTPKGAVVEILEACNKPGL